MLEGRREKNEHERLVEHKRLVEDEKIIVWLYLNFFFS